MGLTSFAPPSLSLTAPLFWSGNRDASGGIMAEADCEEEAQSTTWMDEALAAAHEMARQRPGEDHGILSRAYFAKEQLQLVQKYQRICVRLERYGAELLSKRTPLVPVHFPVTPLPNTRLSMQEGITRSLVLFCRQLHEVTLVVANDRLAPIAPMPMTKLVAFVRSMANDLWEGMQAITNQEDTVRTTRARLVRVCTQFARECVREERVAINTTRSQCDALACALRDFLDNRMLTERQIKRRKNVYAAQANILRTWVRGLVRRGHGGALQALRSGYTFVNAMKESAQSSSKWWIATSVQSVEEVFRCMHSDNPKDAELVANDDWILTAYNGLCRVGEWLMAHAISEGDELRWLEEQNEDASCWCSTHIVCDAPEVGMTGHAPLLQAPGHLGVFAKGRLRLAAAPRLLHSVGTRSSHSELAGVRMSRLLGALLREGHLMLDRLGSDYANRVVVCEYCKYERAVLSIEAETLVPLGHLVRVPYASTIPDLATARRAQGEAHSL